MFTNFKNYDTFQNLFCNFKKCLRSEEMFRNFNFFTFPKIVQFLIREFVFQIHDLISNWWTKFEIENIFRIWRIFLWNCDLFLIEYLFFKFMSIFKIREFVSNAWYFSSFSIHLFRVAWGRWCCVSGQIILKIKRWS